MLPAKRPVSVLGGCPGADATCVRLGLYFSYVTPPGDCFCIDRTAVLRMFCAVRFTSAVASDSKRDDTRARLLFRSSSPSIRTVMSEPPLLQPIPTSAPVLQCQRRRVSGTLDPCTKCGVLRWVRLSSGCKPYATRQRLISWLVGARTSSRVSTCCVRLAPVP